MEDVRKWYRKRLYWAICQGVSEGARSPSVYGIINMRCNYLLKWPSAKINLGGSVPSPLSTSDAITGCHKVGQSNHLERGAFYISLHLQIIIGIHQLIFIIYTSFFVSPIKGIAWVLEIIIWDWHANSRRWLVVCPQAYLLLSLGSNGVGPFQTVIKAILLLSLIYYVTKYLHIFN